ncbi:MAG: helix-turn-helix transcriptional regulator [Acidimicrobiales bacterium]
MLRVVRADRLVAIVLLLQVHGRMTAAEIAERLETSQRTIRRDLDSLCVAGVPLYPQRGRGGGWALLGGHRIDLTGLTVDEAQALFLATDPATTALGPAMGDGLAAARRKVLAALPEPLRAHVEAASATVLLDQSQWGASCPANGEASTEKPHLAALRPAVLGGLQVLVDYEPPGRPTERRRLQPLGLVCKRGVWYLVAAAPAGLRTYRLSRVRSVTVTGEPVQRPAGFDLPEAWADVQRRLSERAPTPVVVEAEVQPASLRRLRAKLGSWWPVEELGETDRGRVRVTLRFASAASAASELAGLGDGVEVLSPVDVRTQLASLGRALVGRYG